MVFTVVTAIDLVLTNDVNEFFSYQKNHTRQITRLGHVYRHNMNDKLEGTFGLCFSGVRI